MSNNEQDQVITSIDAVVNKMESYFLSTYEEMRQLRQEVQELTRILKAQRAEKMINVRRLHRAPQLDGPASSQNR